MTLNLRVNFKEKQHKRLFKALSVASPPPKRTCSEVSHEESIPDAPMVQMPLSNIARSGQELVVSSSAEKDTCSVQDRTLVGLPPGNEINDKDVLISSPGQEEIIALLRQVSCFIAPEPPATSINAFFPLTRRYFVDLLGDPPITIVSHFPTTLQSLFFGVFIRCSSILPLRRWKW